jgi:hypothetical protein
MRRNTEVAGSRATLRQPFSTIITFHCALGSINLDKFCGVLYEKSSLNFNSNWFVFVSKARDEKLHRQLHVQNFKILSLGR